MMRTHLDKGLWAIALLATLGFTGTAWAVQPVCSLNTPLNFSDSQYTMCFTDVRRGADINDNNAPDLGGTGHTALNFTGGAGPAGDLWLTKWTPGAAAQICSGAFIQADILIHTFNNTKGAGLVALLDSAPGGKGLAVILYDQGNSDSLQLATIDPATGKLTKVKSVSLGAGIAENAWYFLQMTVGVSGDLVVAVGGVSRHTTPTDPNSPVEFPALGGLIFLGSLSALGLDDEGEVGIVASAFSTNVNSSVTNFNLVNCTPTSP